MIGKTSHVAFGALNVNQELEQRIYDYQLVPEYKELKELCDKNDVDCFIEERKNEYVSLDLEEAGVGAGHPSLSVQSIEMILEQALCGVQDLIALGSSKTDRKIARLNKTIDEHQSEIGRHQSKIMLLTSKINKHQSRIEKCRSEIEELKKQKV